jgi:glycosyltransferase involved in cell wall biosynthesis
MGAKRMKLSVVVPVLNEEQVLPLTMSSLASILAQIDWSYEIIAVDDGSTDRSLEVLRQLAAADDRIKVVSFSRNFGHQAAITAGMDFAGGDAIVIIDADLQDPPELIPIMIEQHEKGYDVVSPQRVRRDGDSWFKRKTAACFYWLMRKGVDSRLPPEVGDFRLLSRRVVLALRQCREHQRFMRGLVAWLGFSEILIPFERRARAAGETKYPFWKMIRFAWTAITSFSALPLRLSIVIGLISSALAFAYFVWAIYAALIMKKVIQGWTSVVAFQAFSAGVILLSVGLIGEYIAKIYEESKQRPLYVVGALTNLDSSEVEEVLAMGARSSRPEAAETGLRRR